MTKAETIQAKGKKRLNTKTLVMLALLCAISYVVMYISKTIFAPIRIAGFLTFDLKDVIIAIGGFMFGALPALGISVVVSVLEMITVSSTGLYGLLMNVISTAAFVCPAAYLYKKKHTLYGAVLGLVIGVVSMTVAMMLWNYIITPIYMDLDRSIVAGMLIPTFLPFNLIKAGMNAALTMLLYKPIINGLRKAKLLPPSSNQAVKNKKLTVGTTLLALILLASFVLLGLALAGII